MDSMSEIILWFLSWMADGVGNRRHHWFEERGWLEGKE